MKKQLSGLLQQLGKKRMLYMTCGVLVVLVAAFAAGSVYGRYAHRESGVGAVTAKNFYFSSDYLTNEGAVYALNAGTDGTASVTFSVRNWEDALRISDHDIKFLVTVTEEGSQISAKEHTLTAVTEPLTAVKQSITLSELQPGKNYTVTVTTQPIDGKGYSETLSATFTVLPLKSNVFMHLDTSDPAVVVLTVWAENVVGSAVVSVPAGLIPDGTDPVQQSIDNYSAGEYTAFAVTDTGSFAAPYSSRTYRFFVDDPGYDLSAIHVTVNGIKAEKKSTIG